MWTPVPILPAYERSLKRIQEKWPPVFRPNARQNKDLGSGFDSIKTGKTLGLLDQVFLKTGHDLYEIARAMPRVELGLENAVPTVLAGAR